MISSSPYLNHGALRTLIAREMLRRAFVSLPLIVLVVFGAFALFGRLSLPIGKRGWG